MAGPLSREKKEMLYISKAEELQRIWRNSIDPNYDQRSAVRELTDERLEELLRNTTAQIRFEKFLRVFKVSFLAAVGLFVGLGVIGLLLFGIRQLLAFLGG